MKNVRYSLTARNVGLTARIVVKCGKVVIIITESFKRILLYVP